MSFVPTWKSLFYTNPTTYIFCENISDFIKTITKYPNASILYNQESKYENHSLTISPSFPTDQIHKIQKLVGDIKVNYYITYGESYSLWDGKIGTVQIYIKSSYDNTIKIDIEGISTAIANDFMNFKMDKLVIKASSDFIKIGIPIIKSFFISFGNKTQIRYLDPDY